VKEAGEVLKEILNIPDDIPRTCWTSRVSHHMPSVKKGAIGLGGSYGRGVMVCRSGEHYTGKWGLLPCMRWRESVLGFNWAARLPTLYF